jgi:hypothetical protein
MHSFSLDFRGVFERSPFACARLGTQSRTGAG